MTESISPHEQLLALEQQQKAQQQAALASLMSFLEKDCPEMALFGVFVDRFETDEGTNNVRIWFKNGNYYEGAFSGGTMDGVGKYIWSEGLSYHGTFQKNSLDGFGTFNWPDGSTYEGDVKNGQCHGHGLMRLPNGQMYNGQWNEGKKEGLGTMTYDANAEEGYSGEWAKERRHGFGYYQHSPSAGGAQYAGYWSNGCRHGAGSAVWPEQKQVYSGYWDRGVQQGVGRHVWASDRATPAQYQLQNTYVGDFSAGQRHGHGTFHYAGGASYSGEWHDNMKHGKGKVTFKNGQSYEGDFAEDRLAGGPGYIDIARTPDPRLFERQLSRKVDNDETLSAFLASCIPNVINHQIFNVERADGSAFGPAENHAEHGQMAVNNCCTVLMRFASELRRIFSFYSNLAFDSSSMISGDRQQAFSARSLTRVLWWRLIKDSRMPFSKVRLLSVVDLDRRLGTIFRLTEVHDIHHAILFGDFLLWLLATALFTEGYGYPGYTNQDEPLPAASVCLERFLTEFILPNCCIIHGRLFSSQENAAITVKTLPHLVQLYKIIADVKHADDMTVSGRQLVAVCVAAGVCQATPAVKALAGNVFLSAEADCTSYVFAELCPLEVGEALAEIAEFCNEGLAGTMGGGNEEPGAVEQSPTILGSILQESTGENIFLIRGANREMTRTHGTVSSIVLGGPMGRIDWSNIIQHLLSFPDLADLPRMALQKQMTMMATSCGPRALSGLSSSERSATPQGRSAPEGE